MTKKTNNIYNTHISSTRTTSMNDGMVPIFSPLYFLLLISYFYYYRYDNGLGHDHSEHYHHFHYCGRAETQDKSVSSYR